MHDFAYQRKWVGEEGYPDVDLIRVVLDNLNTPKTASLYEAFAPEEARRMAKKLAFHYPPKHGSWLKRAELEFSLWSRQCLARRSADAETLKREVQTYEARRNAARATIDWRFSVTDARVKLHRLYPSTLS